MIVESVNSGGTLHQAKFALGQNKRLYVVNQGAFQSGMAEKGYKGLLSMGATSVDSPNDIE